MDIPMRGWTNPADLKIMKEFYKRSGLRYQFGNNSIESLIGAIEWRIYTEWSCNRNESDWTEHRMYEGGAFDRWVNDEVHYAIENGKDPDTARQAVLSAVVLRAVELFADWGFRTYPPYVDGKPVDNRNLRCSLTPYLQKFADSTRKACELF